MDNPKITQEFKNFIISLLKNADLTDESIQTYTDEPSMIEFRRAFTHKSYNSEFNQEKLEFYGDSIMNLLLAQYQSKRFSLIKNKTWITNIFQMLQGKSYLSKLAFNEGFLPHILYGRKLNHIINSGDTENIIFQSVLEDTFEAFIGALGTVIRKKNSKGIELCVIYSIIEKLNDKIRIRLDYSNIVSPIHRLKEIYDELGWNIADQGMIQHFMCKDKTKYSITIYGYPLGDRTKKPENKDIIAKYTTVIDKTSEDFIKSIKKYSGEKVHKTALFNLKSKFDITETKTPLAYEIINKDLSTTSLPPITNSFVNIINDFLIISKVSEKYIKMINYENYMIEFRAIFTHKSYCSYWNNDLYKKIGEQVFSLMVTEYLIYKESDLEEGKLTKLKQNIENEIIKKLINNMNDTFSKIIVYGNNISTNPESSSYIKTIKSIVKMLFGLIVQSFDSFLGKGVGYSIVYNFYCW